VVVENHLLVDQIVYRAGADPRNDRGQTNAAENGDEKEAELVLQTGAEKLEQVVQQQIEQVVHQKTNDR